MKWYVAFALVLLSVCSMASEQINVKDIVGIESETRKISDQISSKANTPLGVTLLLKEAEKEKNWDKAAQYIDMRYLPDEVRQIGAGELIRRLIFVWQQQKIIDLTTLNDTPEGDLNDQLPPYRELLGMLETTKGTIPVYLQRVPDGNGGKTWKVSNSTLKHVPLLWDEFGYIPSIEALSRWLPDFTILDLENWQFIGLILIIIFSFLASLGTTWILAKFCVGDTIGPVCRRFITHSLRWFLFFKLVNFGMAKLGLSLKAKVWLSSGLLDYLAVLFILFGVVEVIASVYLLRSEKQKNKLGKAIVRPLSTMLKIVVFIVVILCWLSDAGFNIATLLTGLGIGSLAVALAAQKTLENIFGAFTLYIARPISPGDFCKFGDTMGTVEEIGLRSTRIRTLDRKVVHVPNSEFSANSLENCSAIDRRHYRQNLRIDINTSADEVRQLLIALREMLLRHEKVLDVARRVRFENIEPDALVLVVNAYVSAKSIVEFKAIAEDLNLRILESMQEMGIKLVLPQQRIVLTRAGASGNQERFELAKTTIEKMREEQTLPFPDFHSDTKAQLKGTISWPPQGSIMNSSD